MQLHLELKRKPQVFICNKKNIYLPKMKLIINVID